jgi:hypothetical protein
MLNVYSATDEALSTEIIEWNTLFDNIAGIVVLFGNDQYMFEVTVMANDAVTDTDIDGTADSVVLSNKFTCTSI